MKSFHPAPAATGSSIDSLGVIQHGQLPGRCRILFLVGQLRAGGLEQQICYLLKGMDRKRYLPALAVWNYTESEAHVPDVKALDVPIWGYPVEMSSYRKLREFTRLARTLAPEVVHSYTFFTNSAASLAGRAAGCIAIGSLRNELDLDLSIRKPVLGRLSAAFPRYQISNSHAAARRATSAGKWFKPKQMTVVQNGLDFERFRTVPVPTNPPHLILGIGSLMASKRWDRLLRVAQELKRRKIDCVIQFAGEGPHRPDLEALAIDLGVADRTRFLGYRSDVADLLAGARLVVHTSDGEGTPNAIMEALASGRPVVATDVGDVARLVENGRSGFVVPREDPDALLARIIEVLEDDSLAARMGRNAREFAQREFSLSSLVQDTFEAYRIAGWKS